MNNLGQHITIANIRSALKENLPGLDAQIKMLPKGRSLSMSTDENVKESAVLILFFSENNTLYFCLTKRHSGLKHHPGQISFPGGKCEKHEKNPYDTALRETEEEIGVEANTIELLGKLTDVYISVSNFNIHPYIGYVEEKPNFIINKYEVEELLIFPLHSIFDSNNY